MVCEGCTKCNHLRSFSGRHAVKTVILASGTDSNRDQIAHASGPAGTAPAVKGAGGSGTRAPGPRGPGDTCMGLAARLSNFDGMGWDGEVQENNAHPPRNAGTNQPPG